MTVNLLKTLDDPKKLQKSYITIANNITCQPSEPCDIMTPTIILNNNTTYISANYMYVADWKRFYFLHPAIMLPGNRIEFNASADTLMSYADYILNCDCTVIRSESAGINYFPDNKLPVDPSQNFLQGVLFPQQPFSNAIVPGFGLNFLISINGGSGS